MRVWIFDTSDPECFVVLPAESDEPPYVKTRAALPELGGDGSYIPASRSGFLAGRLEHRAVTLRRVAAAAQNAGLIAAIMTGALLCEKENE